MDLEKIIPQYMHSYKLLKKSENQLTKVNLGVVFSLNHDVLLQKMDPYGVRESALSWFKSYLENRKQYVYCNGESSILRIYLVEYPKALFCALCFSFYI